jgi:phosphatidylglycerophosphatase A
MPLAWALASLATWQFALVIVAVTALAIATADRADRAWGTHDNGRIVIDEVAGYLVTVALVEKAALVPLAVGFVVFRVLDIAKPWPVRSLESLPGGWGVVLDDIAAGVIGLAAMVALDRFGALAWLTGL